MDESLYDEFGNYIGPELAGSDEVRNCCACQSLQTCVQWEVHRACL